MPKTPTESALRARLRRRGYRLRKSRSVRGRDNGGGYRIVDAHANVTISGERFDLTLRDVVEWLHAPDDPAFEVV
jgi:hypothetical protein